MTENQLVPTETPPRRATLYDLTAEMIAVADLLEESGGEIDAETEVRLRELGQDLPAKVDAYRMLMAHFQRRMEAREAEARRLRTLADEDHRACERLKGKLLECLRLAGQRKVVTDLFSVWIAKNGTPSIKWTGAMRHVPDRYKRVIEEVDTKQALEDLRAGQALPEGFVVEFGEHLRTR